ncbi:MAG: aminoglycoside phosphotransferase family protein [Pelagimonas sp.]|uniref:aminoglycoside phosphotransferase family protein n=1 Tax=Pelagimonas sp. TaxID=2073170 RepID=UPI003D6BE593
MTKATHLDGTEAYAVAMAAVTRFWPGWPGEHGELLPLKSLSKPLRATPFRVTGGEQPAVIKVWGPGNAAKAAAQASRQNTVAKAMAQGAFRAVPVLGFDPDRTALLMPDIPGNTFETIAQDRPETVTDLAEKAGVWLRVFHALSLRPAPFRPAGHKAWLDKLVAQTRDGQRNIPDPAHFCACAQHISNSAMHLRKRPATKAVTHRDLTFGNLILDETGTVWGIDFENDREDEPLRDVFSLGIDLHVHGSQGAFDTLKRAYGDTLTDPQVKAFLMSCFSLGLWANTPAVPSKRHAKRLKAAQSMIQQNQHLVG